MHLIELGRKFGFAGILEQVLEEKQKELRKELEQEGLQKQEQEGLQKELKRGVIDNLNAGQIDDLTTRIDDSPSSVFWRNFDDHAVLKLWTRGTYDSSCFRLCGEVYTQKTPSRSLLVGIEGGFDVCLKKILMEQRILSERYAIFSPDGVKFTPKVEYAYGQGTSFGGSISAEIPQIGCNISIDVLGKDPLNFEFSCGFGG